MQHDRRIFRQLQDEHDRSIKRYVDGVKRSIDVFCVFSFLPFALPLILLAAFANWTLRRSAFYGHTRIGRNGRAFTCWKIRTMCANSDVVLQRHLNSNPSAAREWFQNFKLRNDPRVDFLGHLLRRTSIDELPQFWNVLRGDMSIVGPRPVTKEEVVEYRRENSMYYLVRPGLTGLWQTSGRNSLTYFDRIVLDERYVSTMSVRQDLKIIAKTALEVLKLSGR